MFGFFSWSFIMLTTVITNQDIDINHIISETNILIDVYESDPIKTDSNKVEKIIEVVTETEKSAPITITNAIEPTMLEYKHWTGTYSPDIFTLTVNDIPVEPGSTYTHGSCDTPLTVQFDYSFRNGHRKGSKKISYQLNKETTEAKITFSWLDPWKVIIDNAVPVREIT